MYKYVCVCVCVCVYSYRVRRSERGATLWDRLGLCERHARDRGGDQVPTGEFVHILVRRYRYRYIA